MPCCCGWRGIEAGALTSDGPIHASLGSGDNDNTVSICDKMFQCPRRADKGPLKNLENKLGVRFHLVGRVLYMICSLQSINADFHVGIGYGGFALVQALFSAGKAPALFRPYHRWASVLTRLSFNAV